MPIQDLAPVRFANITDDDLRRMIAAAWQRRSTATAWTRYADGAGSGTKPDAEIAAGIAALERELARRAGIAAINTVLCTASKGLS